MEPSFKEGRMESSSLSVHYHVQTTKNRLCKYTSLDIYILLSKTLKLYQILWKLGNHYFQQLLGIPKYYSEQFDCT